MKRRRFQTPSQVSQPRSRRGLPWGKLFLLGLIGVAALAWFAPTIVLNTGLRDQLLRPALKDFPGKVSFASASAGWLSPIEIRGATAWDAKGQEVLTVQRIQTQKNLFSLLLDHQNLGTIRVEQPKAKLELRADGSNIEDLLQPWLAKESTSPPIGITVEIAEGTVEVTQLGAAGGWRLDQINANVVLPQDRQSLTAKVTTGIASAGAPPGNLAADLQWQSTSVPATQDGSPKPGATGAIVIQAKGLPLEIATVALRRVGADLQLAGTLTTDASIQISSEAQSVKVQQLEARNLFVASPSLLGTDRVQMSAVTGSGEISRGAGQWQFRNVSLQSDAGQCQITGSGPILSAGSIGSELVSAFRKGNWQTRGDLDLAKLAQMIPTTLRLKEGTQIASGQLVLGLTSQSQPDGSVWNADVEASNLTASHAGTSFAWKKPIVIKAAVKESQTGIIVDQLTCDSSFLQLGGKGTLEQGQVVVTGDLSQFVNEVGRFVDLGSLQASGKFSGQADWQNRGAQGLSIAGNVSAENFELTRIASSPWQEPKLDVQFSAGGKIANGQIVQIDQGKLDVTAAGDQLDLELLQAVKQVSAATMWPCHLHLRGDLGRWLARMQMFFTTDPWQFDGDELDLEGNLQASLNRVELADTKGSIKNFVAAGSGMLIREPTLQIETNLTYDVPTGEFVTPATTISGSTVALRAENTRIQYLAGQIGVDGNVQYRTNLERVVGWFADSQQPATYRIQGEATGVAELAYDRGVTTADVTGHVKDFVYSTPAQSNGLKITPLNQRAVWQPLWNEPQLELAIKGSMDAAGQQVAVDKLEVAGDSLSIGAAGTVRQPFARCELELTGQYAYDLERLSQRLQGMIGQQLQLVGTGQRAFTFRGPLFAATAPQSRIRPASSKSPESSSFASLAEMLAETSIGWKKLVIQGFEIGEAEVETKLQQGQLTISPLNLPASEGKIVLASRVDVTKSPYIATIEPGVVVDHVRISPEMCRSWLKYLAPLAADATAAEGHFSVKVDDAHFPVTDPTGGNIQGVLQIHQAQIGPGPLSQEILGLVQQVRAILDKQPLNAAQPSSAGQWLDMPEQQLNFQLADHRVYHRDMKFAVKDVAVTTSGWVGLDQQLGLVAVIPVRDEWVAKDRYLASLKGQTIQLPISGTLTKPQVDRTALRQLTQQTVIKAGSNLLQDELNRGLERGLNKLFQPKTAPQAAPQAVPPM